MIGLGQVCDHLHLFFIQPAYYKSELTSTGNCENDQWVFVPTAQSTCIHSIYTYM